jgi:hypothetical protein
MKKHFYVEYNYYGMMVLVVVIRHVQGVRFHRGVRVLVVVIRKVWGVPSAAACWRWG